MFPYRRTLLHEISSISAFIDFYEQVGTLGVAAVRAVSSRKRLLYGAFVVYLYGVFEDFTETLLEQYVDQIVHHARFTSRRIPGVIAESHYRRSLGRLRALADPRYITLLGRGEVLGHMLDAVDGAGHHLSGEVFRHHTSNFRAPALETQFSDVGIFNILDRVCACPKFQHIALGGQTGSSHARRRIEGILDRLIECRNRAAHGKLYEIDDPLLMRTWARMICSLALYLERIVLDEIGDLILKDLPVCRIRCNHVYMQGRVLLIGPDSSVPVPLSTSALLLSKTGGAPSVQWGPIAELRVDNQTVDETVMTSDNVSVRIDFPGRSNHEYYVVDASTWLSTGLHRDNYHDEIPDVFTTPLMT